MYPATQGKTDDGVFAAGYKRPSNSSREHQTASQDARHDPSKRPRLENSSSYGADSAMYEAAIALTSSMSNVQQPYYGSYQQRAASMAFQGPIAGAGAPTNSAPLGSLGGDQLGSPSSYPGLYQVFGAQSAGSMVASQGSPSSSSQGPNSFQSSYGQSQEPPTSANGWIQPSSNSSNSTSGTDQLHVSAGLHGLSMPAQASSGAAGAVASMALGVSEGGGGSGGTSQYGLGMLQAGSGVNPDLAALLAQTGSVSGGMGMGASAGMSAGMMGMLQPMGVLPTMGQLASASQGLHQQSSGGYDFSAGMGLPASAFGLTGPDPMGGQDAGLAAAAGVGLQAMDPISALSDGSGGMIMGLPALAGAGSRSLYASSSSSYNGRSKSSSSSSSSSNRKTTGRAVDSAAAVVRGPLESIVDLPNLSCLVCKKQFSNKSNLLRHAKAQHGTQQFPCPEPGCGRMFKRNDELRQHVQSAHKSWRGYECPLCKHAFTTPSNLRRHARHVHREEYRDGVSQLADQIRALLAQSRLSLYSSSGVGGGPARAIKPRGLNKAMDQISQAGLDPHAGLAMGQLNPMDAAAGISGDLGGFSVGFGPLTTGSLGGTGLGPQGLGQGMSAAASQQQQQQYQYQYQYQYQQPLYYQPLSAMGTFPGGSHSMASSKVGFGSSSSGMGALYPAPASDAASTAADVSLPVSAMSAAANAGSMLPLTTGLGRAAAAAAAASGGGQYTSPLNAGGLPSVDESRAAPQSAAALAAAAAARAARGTATASGALAASSSSFSADGVLSGMAVPASAAELAANAARLASSFGGQVPPGTGASNAGIAGESAIAGKRGAASGEQQAVAASAAATNAVSTTTVSSGVLPVESSATLPTVSN